MIVGILFCVLILGWLGRITLWLSTTLALFVYWRRTKWRKNRSLVEVVEAVVRNFSCLVSLVKCDEKEHMFLIHHTFVQSIRKFFPLPATMQEAFPGSPLSNNTRAYYSRELNLEEEVYLPWNLACDIFGNNLHCKIGVTLLIVSECNGFVRTSKLTRKNSVKDFWENIWILTFIFTVQINFHQQIR